MCNEISARERKRNKIGIFKMCNEILNVQWLMCNLKILSEASTARRM